MTKVWLAVTPDDRGLGSRCDRYEEERDPLTEHRGGCHCGNLYLTLRLSQAPEETRLRACGCSFGNYILD